ncbi:inactive rhomboid protein 1-like isoform X2 [Argopecten irradians]|uniref:inactive rhomboid protein 1-like isoform X2 n=1 Tax=Argopecten irradians TaxID=31199 RepID=UPI003717E8C7
MDAIDDISQESNVPNMQDVILSINNSANGNSFQCFLDEKSAVSDHPTTKAENYDKILKKNTEAVVQDMKDTSENETDDFGKCTNSPTNTNCSANGQDCPSGQKEEPEKHDDKVMKAGNSSESDVDAGTVDPPVGDYKDQDISDDKGSEVSFKTQTNSEDLKTGETQQLHTEESTIKDNEPSGNDIADSTEDSTNEKDIFIAVDSEITFKQQTEGAEAELKMEEKEQSQKDGNSQTQVIEKTNTVVENIEAYVGNGFARIEKALSTTDIKRIQEDSTNTDNQISHEGRKPSGKSTTVLRISVKDINNEFDSINTESNIFGKSDLEEKKDLEVNNDVDSKHSQSQENIVHAKDDEREESEEKLSLKDLAYGNEGYKHFKLYAEIDRKIQVDELQDAKEALKMNYDWRIQQIDEIINVAKAYYKNPKDSKAVSEWHELKKTVSVDKRSAVKSNTDIKFHLSSLHEHRTIFTYILITMQLVSVIVTGILGKLTHIGLEPKLELFSGVKTFMGIEMVHKWIPPNVWIGPADQYLISIGALYAPCMREDIGIQIEYSKDGYSKTSTLGCCEVASRNVAGTTTQSECLNNTNVGVWKEGVVCGSRPSGQNSVAHVLKPCCTGIKGQCQLLSHEHCQFLQGTFYVNGPEHCSQVNCLSSVCGMGGLEADTTRPWLPRQPVQWWRLPLALVYHHGVIHAVLVSLAQLLLFRKIERTLGWLRLTILYFMTGLGGLLTAAIFSPYIPHVGSTATVFGMAGLITAELLHYWHLVRNPAVEMTKICALLIIFLMCGTLPYVDNYSIISGFLLGFFCSVFFLPFLSFKKQQKHCRILLLCFGGPFLFLVYFVLFYVFYKVQTFEECTGCKLFNCVPYTETMCDESLWDD